MSYVDGFVIPVPTANRDAYREVAARMAPVFTDHGALRVVECWGDDVPDGTTTDFRRAVKAEPDETVVFAWIVWPSREVRDVAQGRLMSDPRMAALHDGGAMPFDGKRMIYGGFLPIFDTDG